MSGELAFNKHFSPAAAKAQGSQSAHPGGWLSHCRARTTKLHPTSMGDEKMRANSIALIALLAGLCLCGAAHAQKKGGGGKGGGGGGGDEGPSAAKTNPAIAFVVDPSRTGSGSYLVVASADLSSEIRLNNFANENIYSKGPSWSRDGSQIAYWEMDGPYLGATRLYVINRDGTGRRLVRDSLDPEWSYVEVVDFGEWSPSGKELLIAEYEGLAAIELQTGHRRQILSGASHPDRPFHYFNFPTISPDLDEDNEGYQGMVAFLGNPGLTGGNIGDIFVAPLRLDTDGYILPISDSDLVNLTNTPDFSEVPWKWSPDGAWLAYSQNSRWGDDSAPLDDSILAVTNVGTGDSITLASIPNLSASAEATWSSDGSFLVYYTDDDLMIVPSDGLSVPLNYTGTRKSREKYPAWNPVWNPSGDGGF